MTALGNFSSKRKENYDFSLVNEKVALIPYRRHHVAKYHTWMCDPSILEATASEPLSLDEEYAMQRTWRDDATKVCFQMSVDKNWKEVVYSLLCFPCCYDSNCVLFSVTDYIHNSSWRRSGCRYFGGETHCGGCQLIPA